MSLTSRIQIRNKKKPMLISGYSRQNYKHDVANDILSVIVAFFDPSQKWVISTKDFPIKHEHSNQYLFGESITIDGVKFQPQLEFCEYGDKGYVVFRIRIKSFKCNRNHCRFQLNVRCPRTNTQWIGMLQKGRNSMPTGWEYYTLMRDECITHTQIVIMYDIDIFSMFYQPYSWSEHRSNIISKPNMHILKPIQSERFEWKIDNELFIEFKKCRPGKVFWCDDYFGIGDNFILSCSPNHNIRLFDGFTLRLSLIALPGDTHRITIDYKMELIDDINGFSVEYEKKDQRLDANLSCTEQRMISTDEMRQLSSLKLVVTVRRES